MSGLNDAGHTDKLVLKPIMLRIRGREFMRWDELTRDSLCRILEGMISLCAMTCLRVIAVTCPRIKIVCGDDPAGLRLELASLVTNHYA